jgi:hypothetical protein
MLGSVRLDPGNLTELSAGFLIKDRGKKIGGKKIEEKK